MSVEIMPRADAEWHLLLENQKAEAAALRAQNESYALDIKTLHEQANSASVMLRMARDDRDASHRNHATDIKANNEENAALREQVATLQANYETALMFVESNKDAIATLTAERDSARSTARHAAEMASEARADVATLTADCERYAKAIGNDNRNWAELRHDIEILTRDRNEARAYATCRDADVKDLRTEVERLSTLLATQTKWAQESADLLKVAQGDVERLTKERDGLATGWADVRALREIAKTRETAHLAAIETLRAFVQEAHDDLEDLRHIQPMMRVRVKARDALAATADYAKKADEVKAGSLDDALEGSPRLRSKLFESEMKRRGAR